MEATLETLEAMAGELGASVVINREIEVSGKLIGLSMAKGAKWWKGSNGNDPSASPLLLGSTTPLSVDSTSDTETSDQEEDNDVGDSLLPVDELSLDEGDPNEVIVRSAPVPIAHSFLRRQQTPSGSPMINGSPLRREVDLKNEDTMEELGLFGLDEMSMSKSKEAAKTSQKTRKIKPQPIPQMKTPEQIEAKTAEKRAKRDKRREERRKALLPPVYDYSSGLGAVTTTDMPLDEELVNALEKAFPPSVVMEPASPTGTVVAREGPVEPRLIVEALVVRKAGFGRGFVDLSQFDEELRHLPSFSLS